MVNNHMYHCQSLLRYVDNSHEYCLNSKGTLREKGASMTCLVKGPLYNNTCPNPLLQLHVSNTSRKLLNIIV